LQESELDPECCIEDLVVKISENPEEAFRKLQKCMQHAAKDVREDNRGSKPATLQHKLVIVASFCRSLFEGSREECARLASVFEPCSGIV